jgi:membrane-bound lytic murein transglycosylase B
MNKYLLLIIIWISGSVFADSHLVFTPEQKQTFIQNYALKYKLPQKYIKDTLDLAEFEPASYQLQQPHNVKKVKAKSWAKYRSQFINPLEISRGQDFMCSHQDALKLAETKYQIPREIILGIIGVETSYGKITGHYPLLNTLSTLAFNSPRRRDFFQDELAQYLLMCYQNNIDPQSVIGSVDGGFGLGQFMPSAYMDYAVSGVNGKTPNLMEANDAIMSIANYLHGYGWEKNKPVVLNVGITKRTCRELTCNQKKLSHTVGQWQKYGVMLKSYQSSSTLAELITLGSSNYLALNNFFTIFSYNHSHKYAMVVYQLGTIVAKNGCE